MTSHTVRFSHPLAADNFDWVAWEQEKQERKEERRREREMIRNEKEKENRNAADGFLRWCPEHATDEAYTLHQYGTAVFFFNSKSDGPNLDERNRTECIKALARASWYHSDHRDYVILWMNNMKDKELYGMGMSTGSLKNIDSSTGDAVMGDGKWFDE